MVLSLAEKTQANTPLLCALHAVFVDQEQHSETSHLAMLMTEFGFES